ncbi:MAG: FecR domain-containing protein [Hydrogenophaga sp.]|uniref:FecR domain-containing protein n=1 Tax=Hydrogenophaga sp. TaxID=1904254 RepID=UPI003D0C27E2
MFKVSRVARASAPYSSRLLRMGTVALLGCALAWVAAPAARAAPSQTVVEAVQLPAWVERNGERRAASPGATLRSNDRAITADGSRMLLRLSDQSVIKLGEQTDFLIRSMDESRASDADPAALTTTFKLITGVFRYATDYTSKALGNRRELNLELATATVGIRGTDFWSMTDAAHDAVCVFEGKVEVQRDAKPGIGLDKPGAFWVVFTGEPEKPAGQATPEQLAKFVGQAEMQPGKGIVLRGGRWRAVAATTSSLGEAVALRQRLQTAGYPAEMVSRSGRHEVRINHFATRSDAQAVLARLQANTALGVTQGAVLLSAR